MNDDAAAASVVIEATPAQVWAALIDRASWWPELEFTAHVGSALRETWTHDGVVLEATGTVTRIEPRRLLVFRWREPGWNRHLEVEIAIRALEHDSEVTVIETGFRELAAPAALRIDHEEGWNEHLGRLRRACLRVEGTPDTSAQQ